MAKENVGVIMEQGDLGLHFNPISEEDKKTIKKNEDDKNKKSSK